MSYLTPIQAYNRLNTYDKDHLPTDGALEVASANLDASGPFISGRYAAGQVLAFPRSVTRAGDTAGVVPERVLDWVALEAYRADVDDDPPVSSVSLPTTGSLTFARPKTSHPERLQRSLLKPYLARQAHLVRG